MLDGWWAEGYDGENGWALAGDVDSDHHAQDERDAATLHQLLDYEVLPAFYERDDDGVPAAWLARRPGLAEDARAALQRDPHALGVRGRAVSRGLTGREGLVRPRRH